MGEFVAFRKFITPGFIQVVFWIGVVVIVISAVIGIFTGKHLNIPAGEVIGPIVSIIGGVIGLFFWRMWCELIILWFKIYEELRTIAGNTRR